MLAAEYGDDYDDQYDDPSELSRVSVSAGGGGTDADLISRRDVIESVISVTGGASTSVGDGNKGVTKLLRREKKQREKAKKSTIVRSTGSLRGIGSEGVQDVQRCPNNIIMHTSHLKFLLARSCTGLIACYAVRKRKLRSGSQ